MFYVNHFFRSLIKAGFKGFFFFVLTFSLANLYPQKSYLEKIFAVSLEAQQPSPYFYALISSLDEIDSIRGKVAKLPGVSEVRLIDSEQMKSEVAAIMGDSWQDAPKELLDLNYATIKVVYDQKVSENTRGLIRDYIVRFAGEEKVTLGAVKVDELPEAKESGWYFYLKKYGLLPIFFLLLLFWIFALLSMGKTLGETSYIIEKFQRRSGVSIKLAFSGVIAILLLSLPLSLLWGTFVPFSYITISFALLGITFLIVRSPRWGD